MQLQVNGESKEYDVKVVRDLLAELGLADKQGVAVELNRQCLMRAEYESTTLNDGDKLEIVTLVGGG